MVKINQVSEPLEGAVLEEVTKGVMLGILAAGKESDSSYQQHHEAPKQAQSSSWFGTTRNHMAAVTTKKHQTFPWDAEAVKLITGSRQDQANKPLGAILNEDLNLNLLTEFESSPAVADPNAPQEWNTRSWKTDDDNKIHGYIAQNDDMVVLAFSSRQSAFDWMADVDTSTAFWKNNLSSSTISNEELPISSPSMLCGFFGGGASMCQSPSMITVNRYFYQLFLDVWPKIQQHIQVVLRASGRPRTLHIVGHSIGGAIATLVGCHLILEYDWNRLPHDLVVVNSGSPRVISPQLKAMIEARRRVFALNVRVYRVVKGSDAIITLPPPRSSGGLEHLVDPIFITDSGEVGWHLMGEAFDTNVRVLRKGLQNAHLSKFVQHHQQDVGEGRDDVDYSLGARSDSFEYSKLVSRLPKALRDHLPTSYLQPLLNAQGWRYGSIRECFSEESYTQTPEQRQAKARHNRSKPANYVPKRFLREHPEEIHW